MRKRMRRRHRETSSNPRSSHHGVEKETQCGKTHLAQKSVRRKSNVQTKPYLQTPVCFNLALLTNFANCAQIHAIPGITKDDDQWQLRTKMPSSSRVEGATSGANEAQALCDHWSRTVSRKCDSVAIGTWESRRRASPGRTDRMFTEPQPSNGQETTHPSSEALNFVRDRLFRARLRSLREQRHGTAVRRFHCKIDAKSATECVMAHPYWTRRSETICGRGNDDSQNLGPKATLCRAKLQLLLTNAMITGRSLETAMNAVPATFGAPD